MNHLVRLRRTLLASSTALVLAAATACGSGSDTGSDADAAGRSGEAPAGAEAGQFPVTIEGTLGEATITEPPERVVTLGQGSAETAIALGVTPVGTEEYAWGADETGYLPWIHDAVTERGDELPELVGAGAELEMEKIAALQPDVILAPWSGITQEQFDVLSKIAPTVGYPGQPWSINWDEQIRLIGEALGQPDGADQLVDDLEQQLADAADAHPEYADYTFSYVYTTPDTLGVFLPDEQRVAVVRALGLRVDPVVDSLEEVAGTDSATLSYENAGKLDESDLIFTFYSDEAARDQAMSNPAYARVPAIAQGAVVASDDTSFVTASSMINPLTLPYALDRYVPMIDEAIARAG